ncbi:MAG: beta-ketoacyl synthase N-terminal-like domain-containing protein [Phormidesmis sp.]
MSIPPIAIIGIGCRFPGARTPDEFWQMLRNGTDVVEPMSSKRAQLTQSTISGSTAEPMAGGFLDDLDQFDPKFFGLSEEEAIAMDPQQRLLLEVAWEALENAGQVPAQLAGSRTGVFVGVSQSDYDHLMNAAEGKNAYGATSYNTCIAANRISYQFNFQGPSLAINTACSSSLVALHQALQSLRSGEIDLATVGGVNLVLSPKTTENLQQAGLISSTGRCRSFSANADGYVRSEGAGMVILKRLDDAIANGDRIYATILSSAINHNGKGNGLSGPNPQAQKALLKNAYQQANLSPAEVHYIEANGSGTQLGDALELNALGEVLKEGRPTHQRCLVGSVKTNLGSAEVASGIAGLIKVALSLYHRQIPPHLHFNEPNQYVDFAKVPLSVPTELQSWPEAIVADDAPETSRPAAIAGISAFGLGGSNVHAVLSSPIKVSQAKSYQAQEAQAQGSQTANAEHPPTQPEVFILSAKSEQALRALVCRYQTFLNQDSLEEKIKTAGPKRALQDICYTASVRRSHFPYRLAIVADSVENLQHQLSHRLTEQDAAFCHKVTRRSRKKSASEISLCYPTPALSKAERRALLEQLSEQWLQGMAVDWPQLFEPNSPEMCAPQLMSLPTYAFEHKSYWPAPAKLIVSATTIPGYEAVKSALAPVKEQSRELNSSESNSSELNSSELNNSKLNNSKLNNSLSNELIEPRTPLEKQLVEIWEKSLNIQPIGIRDSFFDLGGTSLLAQEVFAELSRQTGLQFPLNLLFQTPTIEAIAQALNHDIEQQIPNLIVPLKSGQASGQRHLSQGADAPLFLIHAAGSSILFYQPLVQHMQTQRPIYGIQPAFLDSDQARLTNVEEMATYYISQMRLIQPHGPYFIGGASFGGLVSYEIAQQLTQQGEVVETLVLFDHHAPGARAMAPWQQRYRKYWKDFLAGGLSYLVARFKKRFRYERNDLQIFLRQQQYLLRHKLNLPVKGIVGNTFRRHIKLAQRYELKPYSGKLLLIRAKEARENEIILEADLGWSRYAKGGVQVMVSKGGHMSMFTAPHVSTLAQQIDSALAKSTLNSSAATTSITERSTAAQKASSGQSSFTEKAIERATIERSLGQRTPVPLISDATSVVE